MLRTFAAFILVFALLSLIVHLRELFVVLGATGIALCAVDSALVRFSKDGRVSKIPRQFLP